MKFSDIKAGDFFRYIYNSEEKSNIMIKLRGSDYSSMKAVSLFTGLVIGYGEDIEVEPVSIDHNTFR